MRESVHESREANSRIGINVCNWMPLKYREVTSGYVSSTTTDMASFLVEATKESESKFLATRSPAHFEGMDKNGRKFPLWIPRK